MTTSDKLFSVNQLNSGYQTFKLQNISFSVAKGEFFGIIGPNGSGKTTLFRTITGDITTNNGATILGNQNLTTLKPRQRAQRLAIVCQETEQQPIRVSDYVAMGRYAYYRPFQINGSKSDQRIIDRYVHITGIERFMAKHLDELSGGERQLVSLTRALIQEPELLLLDEPTAHLDIKHQIEILDMLQRLNTELGLTVLIIMHDLNLASQYCQRLLLLNSGTVHAIGSPETIVTKSNIETVYQTPVLVTNSALNRPLVQLLGRHDNLPNTTLRQPKIRYATI